MRRGGRGGRDDAGHERRRAEQLRAADGGSARRLGLGRRARACTSGEGTGQPDARRDLRRRDRLGRRPRGDRGGRSRARVVLPYGGSSEVGALGYVTCARGAARAGAGRARTSSSAWARGGDDGGPRRRLGAERVLGVDTGAVPRPDRTGERVRATSCGASADGLRLRLDQVGPGYEQLTDAARQAIDDAGRCEGLILDPVYTAKAMAGLAAAVATATIKPGEKHRVRPHGRPARPVRPSVRGGTGSAVLVALGGRGLLATVRTRPLRGVRAQPGVRLRAR